MRILAVDDDKVAGLLLAASLRSFGADVELVHDGEEAWRRFQQGGFSTVVCDWRMPGLDGLELCRRIRALGGDYVYFILVTSADASEANSTVAVETGVDDFLSKPVTPYELRNRLRVAERILGYAVQVRQLEAFLPICAYCRKVRDDGNYWQQLESYIARRTGTAFSHGICPECFEKHVEPELRQWGSPDPEKSD